MKKRKMNKFPIKFLACRGILAVEVKNKNFKKSVQKRAFTYKDWHKMLPSYFKCTLQPGQPPLLPSVYNMEGYASRGSQSPANRSSSEIQAWLNLNVGRPCTTSSKEVATNFQQEGPSLWISRDLMLKKTLSSQPDSRGKWISNYEDPCAITPMTTNVDKPACRCSQEILCQNIQKKSKKIKQARWVANLEKRLRQKWASRWTENLKGRSRQN